MSQDPNLFSAFKRPRDTLSGVPTTSQQNNNNNSMYSSIPQPASALKRSNSKSRPSASTSRMSLAPGLLRPGATNSNYSRSSEADLMYTVRRDPGRSARKSYAPGSAYALSSQPPPTSARRSSVMRSSVGGGTLNATNSFFNPTSAAIVQRDPRPLRDRNYQAKVAQQILEYLLQNGFELEMKHSLSPTALKSPMQKDFILIFQWLYHRLDPNYRFQKGIEHEVLPILKSIRYPYASTITKSQLTAVGSANSWPTFLGMLHWMLELVLTIERFQSGEYDDAVSAEGIDVAADRIVFRYLTRCYAAWLVENDDHEEYLAEMAAAFEERQSGYIEELAMLEAEKKQLKQQLAEMNDGEEPLKKLDETRLMLESDKKKFIDYIERLEIRIKKFTDTNEKLRAEIVNTDAELAGVEREKASLQEAVDRQGLTPGDIDRMNSEREKLSKGLSSIAQKVTETRMKLSERESEAQSKLEALERAVTRYNSLAYQIGIMPSSSPNAQGKEYELSILSLSSERQTHEDAKLLLDPTVGYQPTHILTRDLRHDIRPALLRLRQEISTRIHEAQDESIKTQEAIDRISEILAEKGDEVDTLHARVQSAVEEYQELKENLSAEGNASNAEIEKLEKELVGMRVGMRDGVLAVEQRVQGVVIERDQLAHAAQALRERFHGEVDRMLNEVIKFKVHIQDTLQGYEQLVEEELKGGDALMEG